MMDVEQVYYHNVKNLFPKLKLICGGIRKEPVICSVVSSVEYCRTVMIFFIILKCRTNFGEFKENFPRKNFFSRKVFFYEKLIFFVCRT